MNLIDALNKIAEEIKTAQYSYGPGYATPYMDVSREIMSKGPIHNYDSDSDNKASEPRGWLYRTFENDLIKEWGKDSPFRPDGMETVVKKTKCKNCKGKGCVECKGIGKKIKVTKRPIVPPCENGRIRDQLRYDKDKAYGPWNRDYDATTEMPMTWDQLMQDKQMLGKPSLY